MENKADVQGLKLVLITPHATAEAVLYLLLENRIAITALGSSSDNGQRIYNCTVRDELSRNPNAIFFSAQGLSLTEAVSRAINLVLKRRAQ